MVNHKHLLITGIASFVIAGAGFFCVGWIFREKDESKSEEKQKQKEKRKEDQILKVDTRSQIIDECDKKGIPIFIDKCLPPALQYFSIQLFLIFRHSMSKR